MRLFVAADVMADAQAALARTAAAACEALGPDASGYRFVEPAQMHLTLVFLGAVAPDLAAACAAALVPTFVQPAFTMTFARLGVFPASGAPKVVWAGTSGECAPIRALRREVVQRLAGTQRSPLAGQPSPSDDGPFHPHVTLARARRLRGRLSDRRIVESVALRIPVRVASIALFESRARSDGPPSYDVMTRTVLS